MSEAPTDEELTPWERNARKADLIQAVRRLRAALAEIPIEQATQEEYERALAKERADFLVATERADRAEAEVEIEKLAGNELAEQVSKAEAEVERLRKQEGERMVVAQRMFDKLVAERDRYKRTVKDLMSDLYQGPWSKRTGPDSQGNTHLVFVHDLASFDALRALNQKDS